MAVQIVKLLDNLSPTFVTGGLVPRGAYNGATAYVVGDSVSYNGSSYICILASTGNVPTNTTYWQVLANKGETGAQGDTPTFYIETPTGLVNGINSTYTVAHTITTVISFGINGTFIHPSDYSTSTNTINFVSPPDDSLSGTPFTIVYV